MAFQSHRGKHALHNVELGHHVEEHARPALPHHNGGSLRFANGTYHHDPYDRPEQPHHMHVARNCVNHEVCPESHWIGGRPQPSWPHHVEFDGSTGLWGYTRVTEEEIADSALYEAHTLEVEEAKKAEQDKKEAEELAVLKAKAAKDPAFRILLKRMGL